MRLVELHDLDGLVGLYNDDCVMTDHRHIGVDEFRGRDGALSLCQSMWEMWPDIRGELHEVLACDHRAMVMRWTWIGTTVIADAVGAQDFLIVIARDGGRYASVDLYGPDDREVALARYAELGGRLPLLGERPSEQLLAQHVERFNAHDVAGASALVTDDFETLDHRKVGIGDTHGRERYERALRSLFDGTEARLDISEVLAADTGVIAARTRYSGDGGAGAGEFEMESHEVFSVRDGLLCRLEHYDDRVAAIARYVELGGGLSVLGDRPPERWWRAYAKAYAARDRETVIAMHAGGRWSTVAISAGRR